MDDILLLSQSIEEYQKDLDFLLGELNKDGWCVNWGKCQFAQKNFEYLEVKLTSKGMKPTKAILRRFSEVSMLKTQQG